MKTVYEVAQSTPPQVSEMCALPGVAVRPEGALIGGRVGGHCCAWTLACSAWRNRRRQAVYTARRTRREGADARRLCEVILLLPVVEAELVEWRAPVRREADRQTTESDSCDPDD